MIEIDNFTALFYSIWHSAIKEFIGELSWVQQRLGNGVHEQRYKQTCPLAFICAHTAISSFREIAFCEQLTVLCMYHCMLDYKQISIRLVACVYKTIYNIFVQDLAEGTATRQL